MPGLVSPDYFRHHCYVINTFRPHTPEFIAWIFERGVMPTYKIETWTWSTYPVLWYL